VTFDIGLFRAAFPEFKDTVRYPDELINFWAGLAILQVLPRVWKRAWFQGMCLYVAHEITMAERNEKTAQNGGVPGTFGGIANSKTVGGASVGYDSTVTSERDGGWWNLTTYGKQFLRLARIFGAGAIQLNGKCWP
jgi:hypothetical protein